MTPLKHSYSSVKTFYLCPFQDLHMNVLYDVKFQETEATRKGNIDHKALELRVKNSKPLPPHLQWVEPIAAKLASVKGELLLERRLAVGKELRSCEWRKRWIGGIVDYTAICGDTAWVIDYKTGNPRYCDDEQLRLMAGMVMAWNPEVKRVKANYLFLKTRRFSTPIIETADTIGAFWVEYTAKIKQREQAAKRKEWPKTPNSLCDWCAVKAAGLCSGDVDGD